MSVQSLLLWHPHALQQKPPGERVQKLSTHNDAPLYITV